jgi:hypothetical protein
MDSLFTPGTVFIDLKASNITGCKPKYFIGMSKANYEDDKIICFVFNTENYPQNLHDGCNKIKEKFFLPPKRFDFQTEPTSIMLNKEHYYSLNEILNDDKIKIVNNEIELKLLLKIFNCINRKSIAEFGWEMLKESKLK